MDVLMTSHSSALQVVSIELKWHSSTVDPANPNYSRVIQIGEILGLVKSTAATPHLISTLLLLS
jgi:hypothetical protein